MDVDAPSAGPAASARALALSLYDASEALQAAQDAARELLASQPLPPLDVDTETILAYARLVSRVRPSRGGCTGRALRAIRDRIAAACGAHGASQGGVQGLAFVADFLRVFQLAQTSHAPFGWPDNHPGVEARRHTAAMYAQLLPPLPTEAQLQASLLHAQPPLPSRAPPGPAVTDALAEAAQAAAQAAADVAALLRSWKPGDPLPKGLPPMPPGWKPGDPLPFAAGRAAEPAVRLHAFAACAGGVTSSDAFIHSLAASGGYAVCAAGGAGGAEPGSGLRGHGRRRLRCVPPMLLPVHGS
jgi:hypothetical protein